MYATSPRRTRSRRRIAIAALNPHAGEGGLFGRQDIDVVEPTIQRLRELIACGLHRLVIVGPGRYPGEEGGGSGLFSTDVMPALRSAVS